MAKRTPGADTLPFPMPPSDPYGIEGASNLGKTAKRVPPLQFYTRMHQSVLSGRSDLALDLIFSNARSSDPQPHFIDNSGTISTWPPNPNFTWVYDFIHSRTTDWPSTNHLQGVLPAGGNVLSLDGHVEWRKWNPNTAFIAGTGPPRQTPDVYIGFPPFFWFPAP
jgi:hypothetical protein